MQFEHCHIGSTVQRKLKGAQPIRTTRGDEGSSWIQHGIAIRRVNTRSFGRTSNETLDSFSLTQLNTWAHFEASSLPAEHLGCDAQPASSVGQGPQSHWTCHFVVRANKNLKPELGNGAENADKIDETADWAAYHSKH